jgi:hypothetical protein
MIDAILQVAGSPSGSICNVTYGKHYLTKGKDVFNHVE